MSKTLPIIFITLGALLSVSLATEMDHGIDGQEFPLCNMPIVEHPEMCDAEAFRISKCTPNLLKLKLELLVYITIKFATVVIPPVVAFLTA